MLNFFKIFIYRIYKKAKNKFKHVNKNRGYCNICEKETIFKEFKPWLRDNYKCINCLTKPRNRALINALNKFCPEWRSLTIHESSPDTGVSRFIQRNSSHYSASYYYEDIARGEYKGEFRSEDLSALTFADNSFDVFITSDVFEHIMNPCDAFREIARVLKPGGVHVFTMPWYPSIKQSVQRAKLEEGKIVYLKEPVYHANPISDKGSLVTYDWGLDFVDIIYEYCGLTTTIYLEKNRNLGLDGEFLEVFISRKKH